jgi:hypothetical protein
MKLHAFLEEKNTSRWELLQHGLFPASSERQSHSTLWHQPFDFLEQGQLIELLFGKQGLVSHRLMPFDASVNLRLIRRQYPSVLDEGYIQLNDLLVVYSDKPQVPIPNENSLFWRDMNLLNKLGMPHRIRIVTWLTT